MPLETTATLSDTCLKMHELTHLKTNFGISALALVACILGWCILCLRKAEELSHSRALPLSAVRQEEERGVPKAAAEERRNFGLGRDRRQSFCLLMFQGPSLLLIFIDLHQMEPPEDPRSCCPLCQPSPCFHHPQTKRRIHSSSSPWGFPSALEKEKLSAAWEWERWWI